MVLLLAAWSPTACENEFIYAPEGLYMLSGQTVSPDEMDMEFVSIPGGKCTVSVPCFSYESGQTHEDVDVDVRPFQMMKTEATVAQWEWVMWEYREPDCSHDKSECGVNYATWYEAEAFCEGIGTRLCSYAEMEFVFYSVWAETEKSPLASKLHYSCDWVADCYHAAPLDLMPRDGSAWTDDCFRPMRLCGGQPADPRGNDYTIGVRCCR